MEKQIIYPTDQWIWDGPMLTSRLSLAFLMNVNINMFHGAVCMQFTCEYKK